jgi:hypothetical protein
MRRVVEEAGGPHDVVGSHLGKRGREVDIALDEADLRAAPLVLGVELRRAAHDVEAGDARRAALLREERDAAVDVPHAADVGEGAPGRVAADEILARLAGAACALAGAMGGDPRAGQGGEHEVIFARGYSLLLPE